jgi:ubiquinone/menaquinone biosynthesis C-methylase UbiE
MRHKLFGAWIFDVGSSIYDFITANEIWHDSCARLLEYVPQDQNRRLVLDLGTGPAVSAIAMGQLRPDFDFIGFDLSQRMLAIAKSNRNAIGWSTERLSFLRGDTLRIPLADGQLDAVTGHSFLYLLPDYRGALREANRTLKTGGYVAFLEPHQGKVNWSWLWHQGSGRLLTSVSLWRLYSGLHHRFSPQSFRIALEQAGFVKIDTEITLGGFGIYGRAQKP